MAVKDSIKGMPNSFDADKDVEKPDFQVANSA